MLLFKPDLMPGLRRGRAFVNTTNNIFSVLGLEVNRTTTTSGPSEADQSAFRRMTGDQGVTRASNEMPLVSGPSQSRYSEGLSRVRDEAMAELRSIEATMAVKPV